MNSSRSVGVAGGYGKEDGDIGPTPLRARLQYVARYTGYGDVLSWSGLAGSGNSALCFRNGLVLSLAGVFAAVQKSYE